MIAEIEEGMRREARVERPEHGQSAEARIEDADHRSVCA
jgi:hypothetical protein